MLQNFSEVVAAFNVLSDPLRPRAEELAAVGDDDVDVDRQESKTDRKDQSFHFEIIFRHEQVYF